MRLQVNIQFYLKDKPRGYRGLSGESWIFGKEKPLSMSELAIAILYRIFDWHCYFLKPEEAEQERLKILDWLRSSSFVREEHTIDRVPEARG